MLADSAWELRERRASRAALVAVGAVKEGLAAERLYPAFYFILFHVQLSAPLSVGDSVAGGQLLGTHVGNQTTSDIAVGVNTLKGWQLLSYFDVMADALFDTYKLRELTTRAGAIISKAERDLDPLACEGETFRDPGNLTNWIVLH